MKKVISLVVFCASLPAFAGFNLVAPSVSSTSSVPLQIGSIVYEIGVGYKGVNSTGGFDTLSTTGSNTVTSDGASERVERAAITCASGSTIDSQSGSWLTSIGNRVSNCCSVAITSGQFSSAPNCTISNTGTGLIQYLDAAPTTSTIYACAINGAGTGNYDFTAQIICMGPR